MKVPGVSGFLFFFEVEGKAVLEVCTEGGLDCFFECTRSVFQHKSTGNLDLACLSPSFSTALCLSCVFTLGFPSDISCPPLPPALVTVCSLRGPLRFPLRASPLRVPFREFDCEDARIST